MKKEKIFLTAQYFLNHKLEHEEVKRQIREFAEKGYQGVFAHARAGLLTPYMSSEWWNIIDVIMEECRKSGMKFQIWDEDYYPSGIVGGRTAWEHPELAARNLNFAMKDFEPCDEIELDFHEGYLLKAFALKLDDKNKCLEMIDITEHCGTRRQEWSNRYINHGFYSPLMAMSANPHWRCSFTDNRFAVLWHPEEKARYRIVGITVNLNTTRTCLMDPRTTKAMLDSTYEEYYKRYGKEFGDLVEGTFFDEPSTGSVLYPWSVDFQQEFLTEHGYDIVEKLAHLAYDIDESSHIVRMHFRNTQHRLMTINYLEQSRHWCEEHKLVFKGHLTRTEWLSLTAAWWPNELRCYKYSDIPCCDPLGKAYGFKDTAAYHTGIKVVSSAAHIFGKELAGSDALAVIGDEVSIRDLKGQLDYQMALGINFFVVHGFSYSIDGPRKDEVPPSIFYQHSEWDYMKELSAHVRNVCAELSTSEHICKLLMLYPSTSLAVQQKPDGSPGWPKANDDSWMILDDEKKIHGLVDELLSKHLDFDFIDEVTISEIDAAKLLAKYDTIILPYVKHIPAYTAEALKKYIAAGGRLVIKGEEPTVLSAKPEKPNMATSPFENLTPVAEIKGNSPDDVFVGKYRKNGKDIFFLYNRSSNAFKGTCDGIPVEIPPVSGIMINESYKHESYCEPVLELNSGWEVRFEENRTGMNFFQVYPEDKIETANYSQGIPYDLMQRQKNPVAEKSSKTLYRYRCTSSGNITDMKMIMDQSAVSGTWKVYVNGETVVNWTQKRFYDCNNIYADIKLKQGTSPQVNLIDIVTEGGELKEMPYLYGDFKCAYRHGNHSFPDLTAGEIPFEAEILSDWSDWGYPTYSGKAVYTKDFEIQENGTYTIDLGRVEDIAEISIDNDKSQVLAWPPYRLKIKLGAGIHTIKVTVSNSPGNMFRNADLPAGLIGPIRIFTIN